MTSPVLEADGIGRSFRRLQVLKSASFSAWPGRIVALMGLNGAGKTTLLKIAVGCLRPHWGRVLFRGKFVARPSLPAMARSGVFFASQDSALTRRFRVRDHLAAVTRAFPGGDPRAVTDEMRLGEFLGRWPSSISGGERQRVSLAMALLRDPLCALLDEPFAGVEPRGRPMISSGLRELRARGCAVVVSGHDVEDLLDVADEVIWVTAGTTHHLGSPETARAHDQFRREYLGPRGGEPPENVGPG
jgi:ABC-type multidrug transport system ATPase subunit